MKIAQIASNLHTVNPDSNHAIYSHTAWLSNGLVDRGNDVTLYAAGDSITKAGLRSILEKNTNALGIEPSNAMYYNHLLISKCYEESANFDIIHSHFTLLSSFYSGLTQTPTLLSFHSPIEDRIRPILQYYKDRYYISFSLAQRKQMPELNWIANIYHGTDTNQFAYNETPKDYLLYLGRITEEKGVHLAIEAAKASNSNLLIAGRSYPTESYWHNKIEKNIDGRTIKYVGEADLADKIQLLQNAKALLFPTQYDEVFGLVMTEAMSCGTPVIAWNKGSVPEVIQDKYTGYVVNSVETMTKAINNIDKISRQACRDRAVNFFSVEKMVQGYERVYLRIIEEHRAKMKR
jgi:glycosyltransferase involved in cell wall biosynthesis